MICPICDSPTQPVFQKHGYWVRECEICDHRCADITPQDEHVERIYGDDYFQGGGDGYPDYLGEAEILRTHGKRYATLLQEYLTPGTVLDIGAAAGFILQGFQESGWDGYGLEPNPSMAEYARTQLGLRVETGALEQIQIGNCFDQQLSEGCDLVTMIQIVAHFYDLRKAFQIAAEITRPGGFWLIETWDRESFVARILGQNWHEYSPPSVLNWFSPDGLKCLAGDFGFFPVAHGRPEKRLNGAHVKSLLSYKLGNSGLGRMTVGLFNIIPDELAVPYPSWDLFWMLLQKGQEPSDIIERGRI